MDDCLPTVDPAPAPLLGLVEAPEAELPPDFFPLRLLLQPGGLSVDFNKPDMLVGRHSQADIRLSLPDISRRHCRFIFSDNAWRVCDLSSLNGVYVNGERLKEAPIFHGDRLRIGSLTFEVDLGPNAEQAASAPMSHSILPVSVRKAS